MIVLRFTVRNHRSIRDETTLDLTRSSLRTLQPKDGNWLAATHRLAGIYGGNGTGKSAVIDALHYAVAAVRHSSTTWQASRSMPRQPFRLDAASREASSMYELEFVLDGTRYMYGFELDVAGVQREWLRDVPRSRWRTLLERDRDVETSKAGHVEVTQRELIMSRALYLPHSKLHHVAQAIAKYVDVVLVHNSHRELRLHTIADSLADETISFDDLRALLYIADIGVTDVTLEERDLPEQLRVALSRFLKEMRPDDSEGVSDGGQLRLEALGQPELETVVRALLFTHRGADADCKPFTIDDESDGTLAWLATAVPALEALRVGGLLLVDEIDASLHPHLLDLLLAAFADNEVNVHGAQLIFTSHESYTLSPLSEVSLQPEQVWFTDKSADGATQLSCLAEFPRHREANVAKRYLTGRYGGTPRLSPSILAGLVASTSE